MTGAPSDGQAGLGVRLTHPERIYWTETGITKGDLAEYLSAVAERILPHVAGRPLTLVRCPGGVPESCFFQKHGWRGMGRGIGKKTIRGEELLHIRDRNGLLALVQSGSIEIHPWGAPLRNVERPNLLALDLDPDEAVPRGALAAAALEIRDRLAELGLESFLKTTGGKGLHVVAPLSHRGLAWDRLKAFAEGFAEAMARDAPERFTTVSSKAARRGKIYLDWVRNTRGATAVAPYSPRARPGARVSIPLAWEELTDDLDPGRFTVRTVPARMSEPDPWAAFFGVKQLLPKG